MRAVDGLFYLEAWGIMMSFQPFSILRGKPKPNTLNSKSQLWQIKTYLVVRKNVSIILIWMFFLNHIWLNLILLLLTVSQWKTKGLLTNLESFVFFPFPVSRSYEQSLLVASRLFHTLRDPVAVILQSTDICKAAKEKSVRRKKNHS